tara:strand:+ start:489 stop:740 length:252 start_codon:yes stop_codon:yes gene_type:complete
MIINVIYILIVLILVFVIFLSVRTIMKIRNNSTNIKKNKDISKIDVTDDDIILKLKELKKLHQEGVLNKNEFKLAKEKLLKNK